MKERFGKSLTGDEQVADLLNFNKNFASYPEPRAENQKPD
jgi:hypothetical protein